MSYLDMLKDISKTEQPINEAIEEAENRYLVLRQYYINLMNKAKSLTIDEYNKDTELQNKILKCIEKLQNSVLIDKEGNDNLIFPTIKGIDLNNKYELTKYAKKGYILVFKTNVNNFEIGIMEKLRYRDIQDIVSFQDYKEGDNYISRIPKNVKKIKEEKVNRKIVEQIKMF